MLIFSNYLYVYMDFSTKNKVQNQRLKSSSLILVSFSLCSLHLHFVPTALFAYPTHLKAQTTAFFKELLKYSPFMYPLHFFFDNSFQKSKSCPYIYRVSEQGIYQLYYSCNLLQTQLQSLYDLTNLCPDMNHELEMKLVFAVYRILLKNFEGQPWIQRNLFRILGQQFIHYWDSSHL